MDSFTIVFLIKTLDYILHLTLILLFILSRVYSSIKNVIEKLNSSCSCILIRLNSLVGDYAVDDGPVVTVAQAPISLDL